MTVKDSANSQIQQRAYLDDEIDLRQYIEVLLRWRREIFLIAAAVALLAGLVILGLRLLPPSYEASSEVAIVRVQSDVNFDERFTTTSDEQTTVTNASARRSALISLVKSDAIAQKVIDRLGELLEPDERDANKLVEKVEVISSGQTTGQNSGSDLIQIVVRSDSPEKAAGIATTWAQVFVDEANTVYGQTPDSLLAAVEAAQVDAATDYERRQAALVAYLVESKAEELSRQIARKDQVIKELQAGEQSALHSLLSQVNDARGSISQIYLQAQSNSETAAFTAQQQGQEALLRSYIDAQYQSQIDVFQRRYQQNVQLLNLYYSTSVRLQKTLDSAQALQKQIADGNEMVDGGTIVNLQLLKVQTFTDLLDRATSPANQSQPSLPSQNSAASTQDDSTPSISTSIAQPVQMTMQLQTTPLQLQVDTTQTMSKTLALADIAALLTGIQSRLSELDDQITELNSKMLNGSDYNFLGQEVAKDNPVALAVTTQEELFKTMINSQPTSAVQTDGVITTGISIPFLNFAELQQIATQYGDSNNLLPAAIATLEAELRQLRADLEEEQAKQRELGQQRDLAWSTFTTINSKVAELRLSKAAAGSEVRFAAAAIPPLEPVEGVSLVLSVAAGGFVGLMLAILYALVASSLGRQPFLQRSPA